MEEFFRAYVEAALWSSTDNSTPSGGYPLDKNYSADDISDETMAQMKKDCEEFLSLAQTALDDAETLSEWDLPAGVNCSILEYAGHDFWLTRNGHGCGFWDGDWPDQLDISKRLDDIAKSFGEFNLYVGDDGKIYGF